MADVTQYFNKIVQALKVDKDRYYVKDAPQSSNVTYWGAVAVHPLQVLESEFQTTVRLAERNARTSEEKRAAQSNALGEFFIITQGELAPLDLCNNLNNININNIYYEQLNSKLSQEYSKCVHLIEEEKWLKLQEQAMAFVTTAIEMIETISKPQSKNKITDTAWKAVDFLVENKKIIENLPQDQQNLEKLFHGLRDNVLAPLSDAAISLASVKALYNIKEFYLYRLMHRFYGFADQGRMDDATRGETSGSATKLIHDRNLEWISNWHEIKIAELGTAIVKLSDDLREVIEVPTDGCLRFYLKGGRALFTTLGLPKEGDNDWDTGVLINPKLSSKNWYIAFSAVNNKILELLNKFRFEYTSLLCENSDALNKWNPNTDKLMLSAVDLDDDHNEYSAAGAIAEYEADKKLQYVSTRPHLAGNHRSPTAPLEAILDSGRPVSINGELIDIGIATRSSIELREHWAHVNIVSRPGRSRNLPVPEVGYFVDDLSTIIREVFDQEEPTPDRKLAKRLDRLKRTLTANDKSFQETLEVKQGKLSKDLTKSSNAIGKTTALSVKNLQYWAVNAFLDSVKIAFPSINRDWLAQLDNHIDSNFDESFYKNAIATKIYEQLKNQNTAPDKECMKLLNTLGGTADLCKTFTDCIISFQKTMHTKISGAKNTPRDLAFMAIKNAHLAINTENSTFNGFIAISGHTAVNLYAKRAKVSNEILNKCWPDSIVEVDFYLDNTNNFDSNINALKHEIASHWNTEIVDNVAFYSFTGEGSFNFLSEMGVINTPPILIIKKKPMDERVKNNLEIIEGLPVIGARQLADICRDNAANAIDFGVRNSLRNTARVVIEEVLGAPL